MASSGISYINVFAIIASLLVEEFERRVAVLDGTPSGGVAFCVTVAFVGPQRVEEHVLDALREENQ